MLVSRSQYLLIFIFSIFASTGCSETGLSGLGADNGKSGVMIEVTPLSLNFGVFASGSDPIVIEFSISNVGSGELNVEALEITGNNPVSFSIWNNPGALELTAGEKETITVLFQPTAANIQNAEIVVGSNDPTQEFVPVNLVGESAVPDLTVFPDPLDMGTVNVGCSATNNVFLQNDGAETLTIYSYNFLDALNVPFSVVNSPTPPFDIPPGGFEIIYFTYTPTDDSQSLVTFQVLSNEPENAGIYNALQLGTGAYVGTYEHNWENPADPPSDIMFLIDHSCSMDDEEAMLASNFSTFINELSNYSTDWQIMIVNQDNGCNNTGILTPSTPNYQGIFSSEAQSYYEPSHTEALLTLAANGVEATDSGECNFGFMRQNAMLHIVMVSDEPEQSPYSWDTYVNQIINKKGNINNVRLSAVAGDYPNGCSTAMAGTGYWESVSMTSGVFLSICSNWASPANLQILAEASVISDSYPLDYDAIPDTIEVYVNGVPIIGTWEYDSSIQSVIFYEGMAPIEGDTIRIVYSIPDDCEI